jgi:hypothetical protein
MELLIQFEEPLRISQSKDSLDSLQLGSLTLSYLSLLMG